MKQNQNPSSPLPIVQMKRICKSFGRVQVLKDVELAIFPGEVHVLAGENGAGKSTLIKILAGVYPDFEGEIEIEGKTVHPHSPQEATALGIAVIHQELSLVPSMSVADNIFLGRSITRHGFVQDTLQKAEARRVLDQLGLDLEVDLPLDTYPIAIQQLVEVAKAMSIQAKVIIMDEPTSALNAPEVRKLFRLITELKAKGYGIVYITHRMEEIEEIADRISVLRDGQYIGSAPAAELPIPKLIQWMVGRAMEQHFPRHLPRVGDDRLRVEEFSVTPDQHAGKPLVKKVSFSVRTGEILGIGGLRGSGASELLLGLFGAYGHAAQGTIKLNGQSLQIRAPRQAIDHGIALLTNDRKATGLVPSMSVIANVTLADLNRLSPRGWRQVERERQVTAELGQALNLRAASLDMEVNELSGGNQQKVVLAKWLQTNPQLLLLDEPTRGVDVGAKHEIYQLMNEWTAQGIAIVLITSEMPELLAMSDRIVVMHRGQITAAFTREQASAEVILEAAMGKTYHLNGNHFGRENKV
ncbi:MAG: sugar ABC transporter ATP-binding protein [Candidatus Vecturithrix sp.]|nr:sugar ABC transporter ATP-binding protein [Candidatus Vecturithrix sp.]